MSVSLFKFFDLSLLATSFASLGSLALLSRFLYLGFNGKTDWETSDSRKVE